MSDIRFASPQGFIFINGFNLGRYWPVVGPQVTTYLPKELLKPTGNTIVVVEQQKVPADRMLHFSAKAILDEA